MSSQMSKVAYVFVVVQNFMTKSGDGLEPVLVFNFLVGPFLVGPATSLCPSPTGWFTVQGVGPRPQVQVGLGSCPIPVGEWRLGWKGESQHNLTHFFHLLL
jgi:hypothetical protein